ncbi:hypothetical protein [Cesiribacter sp. SM1]|uniref:hypothetical protein n=1 Tax=Cesiribacter sp. SM1 TaxID=2861196 RepID=UPI001CD60BE4|nr:hypothetical protein [Cesiribacter sp. SM1]
MAIHNNNRRPAAAPRHLIQVMCSAPNFEEHSPEFYEENNIKPPTTLQPVLIDVNFIQAVEKCEHGEDECHITLQDGTQYHASVPYEIILRFFQEHESAVIIDFTNYSF